MFSKPKLVGVVCLPTLSKLLTVLLDKL